MGARLAKSKWHLFPGLIQSASQVFLLGLRAWAEVDEAVEAPVRIKVDWPSSSWIMEVNLLRLAGFGAIREGLQTVMHDTTVLLAMAMQQPDSTLAKTLKLLCGWVCMGWRISGSEVKSRPW